MTFEDRFPSLKCKIRSRHMDYNIACVDLEDIDESCLDKQRVIDAIEKCRGWEDDRNLDDLKRELGLQ